MSKQEILADLFDFTDKEKEYLCSKKDRNIIKHTVLYRKVYEKVENGEDDLKGKQREKYEKEIKNLSLDEDQEFMWYMMSRHRNIYPDLLNALRQPSWTNEERIQVLGKKEFEKYKHYFTDENDSN